MAPMTKRLQRLWHRLARHEPWSGAAKPEDWSPRVQWLAHVGPPSPATDEAHVHDFRTFNNQTDPARRVCINKPCPGGFNEDPASPATDEADR